MLHALAIKPQSNLYARTVRDRKNGFYAKFVTEFGVIALLGLLFHEFVNLILRGDRDNYGCIGTKCLTTVGVRCIADFLANDSNSTLGEIPPVEKFKYHFWGTGTSGESAADTTMTYAAPTVTPGTAVVGTHVSSTSAPNAVFTSIATITAEGTVAITEHGIFWFNTALNAVVLIDRTKFSAINLLVGNSIQFTYAMTIQSGY
jgi:hypothetical protein